MTSSEIAQAIAKARELPFSTPAERKRLTSGVLSALKRYRDKGLVAQQVDDRRVLRWSIRK